MLIKEKDGSFTVNVNSGEVKVERRKVLESLFTDAKKQNSLVLYLKLLFRGLL